KGILAAKRLKNGMLRGRAGISQTSREGMPQRDCAPKLATLAEPADTAFSTSQAACRVRPQTLTARDGPGSPSVAILLRPPNIFRRRWFARRLRAPAQCPASV